jgi:two-component system NtrC family sensor kinase
MKFSLSTFDLAAMLRCGLDLRRETQGAASMEEAARAVVRYFYDSCVDPESGERQCALVRFYKTHAYGALEPGLQAFVRGVLGARRPRDEMKCLVLLATAGDEPAWNHRRRSRGHQAIPLPSRQIVEQAPMIAQLIRELGLDLDDVVRPRTDLIRGLEGKTYNVFHVPEALGSPYIPAQDGFVRAHGIRSVVGCGGILLSGDFYSLILFSRVSVPADSADRFRNIALDLKLVVSPFAAVFAAAPEPLPGAEPEPV